MSEIGMAAYAGVDRGRQPYLGGRRRGILKTAKWALASDGGALFERT